MTPIEPRTDQALAKVMQGHIRGDIDTKSLGAKRIRPHMSNASQELCAGKAAISAVRDQIYFTIVRILK